MPAPNPNSLAAGSLNKSITIQKSSRAQDAFGQPATTWVTVLQARASIRDAGSAEKFAPNQFTTQISHIVTIRYPGDDIRIATGMRVLYRAHTYNVQYPENVEAGNRVLRLHCQELNSDE